MKELDRAKEAWVRLMKMLERVSLGKGCDCMILEHVFKNKYFPKCDMLRIYITPTLLSDLASGKKITVSLYSSIDENEKRERLIIKCLSSTEGSVMKYVSAESKSKDRGNFGHLDMEEYCTLKVAIFEALLNVTSKHVGKATLRRSKPKKPTTTEKKVLSITQKTTQLKSTA